MHARSPHASEEARASGLGRRLLRPSVLVPLAALTAMLAQAGSSIATEWQVRRFEQAAALQEREVHRTGAFLLPDLAEPDTAVAPRAAALRAVMRTRAASTAPAGAARNLLLAGATRDADLAASTRPMAGFPWIAKAYVHLIAEGAESPSARAAFAQSYAASGYLRDSVDWRLRYAADHWAQLAPETRAAAVREGQWLSWMNANLRVHVYVLTGGTPLYKAISGRTTPPVVRPRRAKR
jgi:hypothetical protein